MVGHAFWLDQCPYDFSILDDSVFQTFLRKFVLVFFDDILVYSSSWQAHLSHLQAVLKLLQ